MFQLQKKIPRRVAVFELDDNGEWGEIGKGKWVFLDPMREMMGGATASAVRGSWNSVGDVGIGADEVL